MIGVARANTRFVPPVLVMDIGIRLKARQSNRIANAQSLVFVIGRRCVELPLQPQIKTVIVLSEIWCTSTVGAHAWLAAIEVTAEGRHSERRVLNLMYYGSSIRVRRSG